MDKMIIFYEDSKQSCRQFAQKLEQYENVQCRKASLYRDQPLIFAKGSRIGLVFESSNGKVPDIISHVIWRIVAEKQESHMIYITGGSREFLALRRAREDMQARGYAVKYIYTGYILEKLPLEKNRFPEYIMESLKQNRENVPAKGKKEFSKKEIRKKLWQERKQYKNYKKKQEAADNK